MADQISAATSPKRRPSKKAIAIIAAIAVLLAGGITITSVSVARADAAETARQCTAALKSGATASQTADASVAAADQALETVTVTALPDTDGWESGVYAERPAVEAVEAVEAVPAAEGVEGVEAVEAVAGRPSAAELTGAVTDSRDALAAVTIPTTCVERDDAAAITALADDTGAASVRLDEHVAVLAEDFAAFQVEETARITAEKEAARKKAEEEAARKKAEEAAKKAAEQAAARKRAQQQWTAPKSPTRKSGSSGSSGGKSGGQQSQPSPPRKPGGGGGGGQIGDGTGGCRTDNGQGGTKPC